MSQYLLRLMILSILMVSQPVQVESTSESMELVPSRSAVSFTDSVTGMSLGTANQFMARAGLSTVKLYMVQFVMDYGDGSASDMQLSQAMIERSDDAAASIILGVQYRLPIR